MENTKKIFDFENSFGNARLSGKTEGEKEQRFQKSWRPN